jgi:2-oxoglutarate ferredoxin oxidoreductase subunit alpha
MVRTRRREDRRYQARRPDLLWTGPDKGEVLIIGWGSTYGAIKAATMELQERAKRCRPVTFDTSTRCRRSLAS